MVRVEANTVEEELMGEVVAHVGSSLEFNVESGAQFEDEAEGILWNTIMFMEDHSELTAKEILLSMIAQLENNGGENPYRVTNQHEEVEEDDDE